ncbi:rhombosortase [Ferrimonas pelagia]|uniref:Rhombosortase n=1 Tax=Ferrimonas pelagia TaxID=1177826 RepID=A0ABP9EB96_9GAMM
MNSTNSPSPQKEAARPAAKGFGLPSWDQLGLPLLLTLLALLCWLWPGSHENLIWSRQALAQDQWWRMWTGHLLHSNTHHLLLNLAGLAAIFALHQPHYRTLPMLTLSVLLMGLISLGIWWGVPGIERYVGLSALLHGLFTWGALQDIRRGWRSGWLLLLGVIAKVGWEQFSGGSESTSALIDARIAVESHLLGVVSALFIFLLLRLYHWAR